MAAENNDWILYLPADFNMLLLMSSSQGIKRQECLSW